MTPVEWVAALRRFEAAETRAELKALQRELVARYADPGDELARVLGSELVMVLDTILLAFASVESSTAVRVRMRLVHEDSLADVGILLSPGERFAGAPFEWWRDHPGEHDLAEVEQAWRGNEKAPE